MDKFKSKQLLCYFEYWNNFLLLDYKIWSEKDSCSPSRNIYLIMKARVDCIFRHLAILKCSFLIESLMTWCSRHPLMEYMYKILSSWNCLSRNSYGMFLFILWIFYLSIYIKFLFQQVLRFQFIYIHTMSLQIFIFWPKIIVIFM